MKVMEKSAGYSIDVGKDNPYAAGIGFLVAGGIITLIMVFIVCMGLGIIQMSPEQGLTLVSLFLGGLTLAIILCFTLPIFHRASNAEKVTGKIVDVAVITHTSNGRRYSYYSPVVEYDYEGKHYKKELASSSTKEPEIGEGINLKVYDYGETQEFKDFCRELEEVVVEEMPEIKTAKKFYKRLRAAA